MRYRLRTLLIVLALGPPVLAGLWLYPYEITGITLMLIQLVICFCLFPGSFIAWYWMVSKARPSATPATAAPPTPN